MDRSQTTLERAFELAKSGKYTSVADIKQRLKSEGYALSQIQGPALAKQLKALAKDARARLEEPQ